MKKAFTLAEVLITLGVIGIVAAMTIPTLMQKTDDRELISRLRKSYSIFSQAYQQSIAEKSTADKWDLDENPERLLTYITPYLNTRKLCLNGETCHKGGSLYEKNGNVMTNIFNLNNAESKRFSAILTDGMIISTYLFTGDCNAILGDGTSLKNGCGEMIVDINGSKSPNTFGKDIFIFQITKNAIIPNGTIGYYSPNYSFDTGCLDENSQGWGCTAWVITNENMDYLHCNDLSWTGKTHCD